MLSSDLISGINLKTHSKSPLPLRQRYQPNTEMLTHFWALGLAVPADITPAFFSGGLWNLSVVSRERGTEKKHARTCIKFHLNLKSPFNVWTFISLILYTCIPHIPYQLQTTYNIHRPLILSFIFHFMNFWPICTACSLSIHCTF